VVELIHQFIESMLHFFEGLGYWGIMLGLMVEVIPSEIVLAYGGYLVSDAGGGELKFFGAVVFGTIGGTIAQLFLYWIGRYGGRPVLEKYGKYLMLKKRHLDLTETWVAKYGTGVIFFARFIPVVRHAVSVPAGIAKMSHVTFLLYTTLAIIPWSIFFVYLGMQLGDNGEQVKDKAGPYVTYFIITAVILIACYILYVRKRKPIAK
jgi:membrane protein DedA with SNARE-associated domain